MASASSTIAAQLPAPFTLGSLVRVQFATSVNGPASVEGRLTAVDSLGICLSEARLGSGEPATVVFLAWPQIAYLRPHPLQPSDQPA